MRCHRPAAPAGGDVPLVSPCPRHVLALPQPRGPVLCGVFIRGFYSQGARNGVGGSAHCCPCAAAPALPSARPQSLQRAGTSPAGSYPAQAHVVAALLQVQRLQELLHRLQGGRGGSGTGCKTPGHGTARGAWHAYPLLVHHDVVAPVLLGQVRGQDVEAPPELGEHHVVGVAWGGEAQEKGAVGQPGRPGNGREQPRAPARTLPPALSFERTDGATLRGASPPRDGCWRFSLALSFSNFGQDVG